MICPTCDGSGTLRRDTNRVDCPYCDGAGWTPTRKPAPVSGCVGISVEEYERVCARVRELEEALLPFATGGVNPMYWAMPRRPGDEIEVTVKLRDLRQSVWLLSEQIKEQEKA